MSFQIRISPDGLHAAAERQNSIAKMVNDVYERLGSLSSELNAAWDGGASRQALGAIAELRDTTEALAEGIGVGARKLNNIAQAFENLDEGDSLTFTAIVFDPGIMARCGGGMPSIKAFLLNFSGTMRIVPDAVRHVAEALMKLSSLVEDAGAQLNANMKVLSDEWEGKAYLKYAEETKELLKGIKKLNAAIEELAGRIRAAAIRYEEIDNMY